MKKIITSLQPVLPNRRQILLTASAFSATTLLQACGGGGGGGGGGIVDNNTDNNTDDNVQDNNGQVQTPSSPVQGFVVVPALGGFSSGATVSVINPADGRVVGSVTTNISGEANIELTNYSGPFVLRVSGAANVNYYDEGSTTLQNFTEANNVMYALIPAPATTSIANGARIGITPLTHMAAAFAGISIINGSLPSLGQGETYRQVMLRAYARVRQSLGLLKQTNDSVARALNPLVAPRAIRQDRLTLDVSEPGAFLGVLLAELASESFDRRQTPFDFARAMFDVARGIREQNFSLANSRFADSDVYRAFLAVANTLSTGRSGFIGGGNNTELALNVQSAFDLAARSLASPSFSNTVRDEISDEISQAIQLQLTISQNTL